MNRTLVIDSATDACSVALFQDDELLAGEWVRLGRGHAERLIPMIAELPGRGMANRIAVALGPGSFTGIRVGLAAAKALAVAWNCELVGYPTLALLAAQGQKLHGKRELAVANTGGHGEWFVEEFGADGASLAPVKSLTPQDAAGLVRADLIVGSQAEALVASRGRGTAAPLSPDARQFGSLAEAALLTDLRPLYGRGPDAKLPTKRAS
ncbi:tRNA (adenosine(37)-N6)-threonylcarbamoyltransferase complex dimerization subunit type 1 TsaB [Croceicoccus ponticola]|uniref:tRNA (Adenosine(37)-N6)-threonylcarbamoyltransferase complex dimerization subunit type 1 TsaB n=1 Tax=Croceicoccus ponticola TaxID=2217664 RepID=A0A437H1R4_9SPHN|nr:tRNA (adenosine(37)-N6)-threonylcarbamoyltransferase complex dimerization subunit type 1 TsaB [Croceicoccus ponticola]RVQ69519.1 tRNA (adenosine(37)-N6)-threonylcarbamoyltransferase complex dimerization subunit type 1 TsaB [Croceicoccus ponticola]